MMDKKIETIAKKIWSLEQKCQEAGELIPEDEQEMIELMTSMEPQDLLYMIAYLEEELN